MGKYLTTREQTKTKTKMTKDLQKVILNDLEQDTYSFSTLLKPLQNYLQNTIKTKITNSTDEI